MNALSVLKKNTFLLLTLSGLLFAASVNDAHAQAGGSTGGTSGGSLGEACLDFSARLNLPSELEVMTVNGQNQVVLDWGEVSGSESYLNEKVEAFNHYLKKDPVVGTGEQKLETVFGNYVYQVLQESENVELKDRFDELFGETLQTHNILKVKNLDTLYADFYPYLMVQELKNNPRLEEAFKAAMQAGLGSDAIDTQQLLRHFSENIKGVGGSSSTALGCVANALEDVTKEQLTPGHPQSVYGPQDAQMQALLSQVKHTQLANSALTSIKNDATLISNSRSGLGVGLNTFLTVWANNPNVQSLMQLYRSDPAVQALVDGFFESEIGREIDLCVRQAYGSKLPKAAKEIYVTQSKTVLSAPGLYSNEVAEAVVSTFQKMLQSTNDRAVYQEARRLTLDFINDYLALEAMMDEITSDGTPFADDYYNQLKQVFSGVEGVFVDIYRDDVLIQTITNPNVTRFVDQNVPLNESGQIKSHDYHLVVRTQCNAVAGEVSEAKVNPNLKQGTPVETTASVEIRLKESQSEFFMDTLRVVLNALLEGKTSVDTELLKHSAHINAMQYCSISKESYLARKDAESLVEYGLDCFGNEAVNEELRTALTENAPQLMRFLEFNQFKNTDQIAEQFVLDLTEKAYATEGSVKTLIGHLMPLKVYAGPLLRVVSMNDFSASDIQLLICGGQDNCGADLQRKVEQVFAGTGHSAELEVSVWDAYGNVVTKTGVSTNLFGQASGIPLGELKTGENYNLELKLKDEPYVVSKKTQFTLSTGRPSSDGKYKTEIEIVSLNPFFYGDFDQDNRVTLNDMKLWADRLENNKGKTFGLNLDGFDQVDLKDVSLFQKNYGELGVSLSDEVMVEADLNAILRLFTGNSTSANADSDGDGMGNLEELTIKKKASAATLPVWLNKVLE